LYPRYSRVKHFYKAKLDMSFHYIIKGAVTNIIKRQLIYLSGLTNKQDIQLQAAFESTKSNNRYHDILLINRKG